jgi:hypothetical protein
MIDDHAPARSRLRLPPPPAQLKIGDRVKILYRGRDGKAGVIIAILPRLRGRYVIEFENGHQTYCEESDFTVTRR